MNAVLPFFALAAALLLTVPIAVVVLFWRTRQLRARLEALENEVRGGREVPVARAPEAEARTPLPGVPGVHEAVAPPREAQTRLPEVRAGREGRESLETAIGARGLLYVGIIAIIVGIAYFEKLAIDYAWIGETARVVQGGAAGLALMYAGTRFAKRGYAAYGQMIAGGGGAILYLSTYAAFNLYALIARGTAFALMVAITVLIGWLADRQRSQGLALFAVGGGFATPFLLPGTSDAQIALFTYDAILIGGTAVLSRRREWPFLHLVSYLFTMLTVAVWADRFYTPAKYLRTELYLTLYCALFTYIAVRCRRGKSGAAHDVGLALWTAPAAYYLASLAILAAHSVPLLVWLVAFMVAGAVATARVGPGAGLGVWTAVALPLVLSGITFGSHGLRREGLIGVAAVYVIALLAELEGTFFRDQPRQAAWSDVAWVHLNPLVMFAAAYTLIAPLSLVSAGHLAAACALWNAAIAVALWRRRPLLAPHFAAVAFALAAIGIALVFSGAAVTAGWAAEGAAVIVLAVRQRITWLRVAGILLFAVAVGQAMGLAASAPEAGHVVVLNARAACAALVIALCYLLASLDRRQTDLRHRDIGIAAALLTAQLVTLVLLTGEINAYWAVHGGRLERELMLSVTWGVYATVLVVVGLSRNYPPIRYFAIVVLAFTIAKVFLVDTAQLDRIYRVGSVIVLGILLLLTSYLYSRATRGIDDLNGRV